MPGYPRIFISQAELNISDNIITVTGTNLHHIKNVLRMKINEKLVICDMKQTEYLCYIDNYSADSMLCNVESICSNQTENPMKIYLYQGFPKADKFDFIIQKATELGVFEIIPVISDYCVARPDPKAQRLKRDRFNKIARSAAEQSGRGIIPAVRDFIQFDSMLSEFSKHQLSIICNENEDHCKLRDVVLPDHREIAIYVGPEGGISKRELSLINEMNLKSVTLGKRILRTETAAIFVLSAISAMFE